MLRKPRQIVMHCPCGNAKVLAKGLCATCYTLKRQDEDYFGGHREEVLKRDNYRCRVPGCITVKRGKQSIAVHHREPGNSNPAMMLTLCLACHAKVTRTLCLQDNWPEFLRVVERAASRLSRTECLRFHAHFACCKAGTAVQRAL